MRSVWSPKATWPAGVGIEPRLQRLVQRDDTRWPAIHRREHLNIGDGVEPIFRGQAAGHQIDDQPLRGLGIGGGRKKKSLLGADFIAGISPRLTPCAVTTMALSAA